MELAQEFNGLSDDEVLHKARHLSDSLLQSSDFELTEDILNAAASKFEVKPHEIIFLSGRNEFYKGNYEQSILQLSSLINELTKDRDVALLYESNRFIAFSKMRQSLYEDAINILGENQTLAKSQADSSLIFRNKSDLAIANYTAGNYKSCARYWEDYAAYCEKINAFYEFTSVMGNLGLVYIELKNYAKAEQNLKSSLRIADSLTYPVISKNSLTNLAKLEFERKNYNQAEAYMLESIDRMKETATVYELLNAYNNLGEIFTKRGKFKKGKEYLDIAYGLARGQNNLSLLSSTYYNYADYFGEVNDYKNAYLYLDSAMQLKDTLLTVEKLKSITEVETKFRVQQKDDSIQIGQQALKLEQIEKAELDLIAKNEKAKSEKKSLQMLGLLLILGLSIGMLFFILRNSRIRKKANIQLEEQKSIIEEKNKNITDSIRYAKNLQTAILPDISIIREVVPNYVLYYQPRDIVSGDFYWFHEGEDKVFLAAADCTGHGVPGAFVSMLCNDALNKVVITLDTKKPGEILTKVNQTVIEAFRKENSTYKANDGMDIALCVLDKKTRQIEFSGATNRLLLIRNGEIQEFKGDKTSIGGRTDPNFEFTTQTVSTQEKDCIYMFSDGYIDQFGGEKGKKYMIKRLKDQLLKIHPLKADEQKVALRQNLLDWRGSYEQVDDILVIGFEI